MSPEIIFTIRFSAALALIVGLCMLGTLLRNKYYAYIENKLRQLLRRYPITDSKIDDGWARIDYQFYYPFLLLGRQTRIVVYVHWSKRRDFLNGLFRLSLVCNCLSLVFPVLLIINLVAYHNNVYRYP